MFFSLFRLSISLLFLLFFLTGFISSETPQEIFRKKMALPPAGEQGVAIKNLAISFVGTPYKAYTLEGQAEEQLICRLDAFDCTTLVEQVMALAVAKYLGFSYEAYLQELQMGRYRDGNIEGYASRIHYFTEWADQAEQRRRVRLLSRELGGAVLPKPIRFMSANTQLYPKLSDQTARERITIAEKQLSDKQHFYVPKDKVKGIEASLRDGDIIGITSSLTGLDCSHAGIVLKKGNAAYLIHASSELKKVVVSKESLADYLLKNKKQTGIMVLRPLPFVKGN